VDLRRKVGAFPEDNMIIKAIFWILVFVIAYIYIGYALLIYLISLFADKKVNKKDFEPSVTILITAYNEQKNIRRKLDNALSSDYPKNKLEIIVASDGSTDHTDSIVKEFAERNVRLIRIEGRKGKTSAQNAAIKAAKGEIVVFSDATTVYMKDALRKIVRNFNDEQVGCVSGRLRYVKNISSAISVGSASYWEYEVFIRESQTKLWSLGGATGCIYAIRTKLFTALPEDIISDLVEPLEIFAQGYRVVFEPEAVALEDALETKDKEMKMRIRVITRAMSGFLYMKRIFNPLKYPYLSFHLMSHKVLRWFFFELAFSLLLTNIFLVNEPIYRAILLLQIVFYGFAVLGYFINRIHGRKFKIFTYPFYFCLIHVASVLSLLEIIKGKKRIVWETNR
jgi:cellulose synthase/poly-beta-1,6-N-acetylglucosamine synthase-like glycosyltransferase